MLAKSTLNRYIENSIKNGKVTEELKKSLDNLYKQINSLLKDNQELNKDKNNYYTALLYYSQGNHIRFNTNDIKNNINFKHLGNMAIESGKIARDALIK